MAIVRQIISDAMLEIGVISANEALSDSNGQVGLRVFQRQLDAWLAERATLAIQKRVTFTMPSGQSTRTIGPGGQVDTVRPTWLDTLTYVNPGSSPQQEVQIALLTPDAYASGVTIKSLPSGLPLQAFYQTSTDTVLGTLFVWPQVTQNVIMWLYFPSGIAVPVTLDDVLLAPPGYLEALVYQLALRLVNPMAAPMPPSLPQLAEQALARAKRPNMQPGQLGVDPALVGLGAGYNVLSDSWTGQSTR